jgi:hypothetical protein
MARHDKRFRSLFAIACGAAWLLGSARAHAYEEQASLDAALGYALVVDDDVSAQGASAELGASWGLSDTYVARATLGYASVVEATDAGRAVQHLGRLRVEALYLLDVLKVVPFFGLGASLTNNPHDSGQLLPVRLGGHLVFGVDYLASRSWTLGLDVRAALLFEGNGQWLNATDIALRVSRMFETF